MLVAAPRVARDGGADGGADRPRPKQPEVLVTTASTGAGVPELLAALDRHRNTSAGPTTRARLARAEAQVWAILGDRLRAQLHEDGRSTLTGEVMTAVAEHRLDPYSAADRLLNDIVARRG
jgi:LAO/AO transport system kinase